MTRPLITWTTLIVLTVASFTAPATACHPRTYRPSYSTPHAVRIVRPVTVVPRAVVARPLAVAPSAPEQNLPTVPAGAQLTLPANFLGNEPGSVLMVFSKIKLPVQVDRWADTAVTITLPPMAIKDAVVIRLDIVLPHGKLAHTQELRVTAPAPVVLHPVSPTPALPTQAALPGGPSPALAGPRVSPGAPIVLRSASSPSPSMATGNPLANGQPPTLAPPLATATPPATSAPPQLQGNGTPEQPFVLPAIQPGAANAAPVAAQPAATLPRPAVTLPRPAADLPGDDAWLDNNPILQEGLLAEPPAPAPATEQIEPADEIPHEDVPANAAPGAPSAAPVSASSVTSALSIFAKLLLPK